MPIEAICEKYVGIFSFSWVFCSAAEFPNPLRSWRVEGLVNSEQRRRFNRLVNRLTKILSEAGTQEPTEKNGQRLAGYIASLTTPALVKHFFSTPLHALREERHFALAEIGAIPTKARS